MEEPLTYPLWVLGDPSIISLSAKIKTNILPNPESLKCMKHNVQYTVKISIYKKHIECDPESKEKPEI